MFRTDPFTDECLNTVVNHLTAANRVNPDGCEPANTPLQDGDFVPFRTDTEAPGVRRLVVVITDTAPTGFCDRDFTAADGVRAHGYALDAIGADPCIKISGILVAAPRYPDLEASAKVVMQDYRATACGWYAELPQGGAGVEEAVAEMLYTAGACSCP